MALALLLSACPPNDDPVDSGNPGAPTICPEGGPVCISVFEATSEPNKSSLTVINKSGADLESAYNIRVHVIPEAANTLVNPDDYPIAKGTPIINGGISPIFSTDIGLNWILVDTALANDASETAIIEVTTTLASNERLLACTYATDDITVNTVVPIHCKKL